MILQTTCTIGHIIIIDFAMMRGSFRWFLTVFVSPTIRPKVKIRHRYWYSSAQIILSLTVSFGRGQHHVMNKLSFMIAITFFNVKFFMIISHTHVHALRETYTKKFLLRKELQYYNKWMHIEENVTNEVLMDFLEYISTM